MQDKIFRFLLILSAVLIPIIGGGIIFSLTIDSSEAFGHFGFWHFVFSDDWVTTAGKESYGALPFITGTLLTTILALASCRGRDTFSVSGTLEGTGEGQMVYLEHESLEGIVPLDSAEAASDGSYSLSGPAPGAPDFYRLRVGNEIVHFCIDSCEQISLSGKLPGLSTNYSVEGNEDSRNGAYECTTHIPALLHSIQ